MNIRKMRVAVRGNSFGGEYSMSHCSGYAGYTVWELRMDGTEILSIRLIASNVERPSRKALSNAAALRSIS